MCLPEAAHHDGHALGSGRLGDVPYFVPAVAERAQEVHLAPVGARELAAIAHAYHLGAAGLTLSRLSRNVHQILRPLRIGDIENRSAVALLFSRQGIELTASMVADVGDPAISLFVDDRLVRASRLQIAEADQLHVVHFGPLLRRHTVIPNDAERAESDRDHRGRQMRASHVSAPSPTPAMRAGDRPRRYVQHPPRGNERMNVLLKPFTHH